MNLQMGRLAVSIGIQSVYKSMVLRCSTSLFPCQREWLVYVGRLRVQDWAFAELLRGSSDSGRC